MPDKTAQLRAILRNETGRDMSAADQVEAALSLLDAPDSRESELLRLLLEYEDAAFNRGEGEDYGGHKLVAARAALYSFLGCAQQENSECKPS
jgi:hypothetical protein